MKIALSATGPDLAALIDPRFGRCPFFIIADMESNRIESFPNPALMASGGAGIQAAQSVVEKGVDVVITGNIGPNAFNVLNAAQITIITGITNIAIETALTQFSDGTLKANPAPSVDAHWGMGMGIGMGMGMGRGGGGGGGGRGAGRRMGP